MGYLPDRLPVPSEWCIASSLPMPVFASTGQIGNLDKSSDLGLVQGAELTVGFGTPSIPRWEQGIMGGPLPIPWG